MTQQDTRIDDLKFDMAEDAMLGTKIKVIGVGGGGCNAVARMIEQGLSGVEFHVVNTDQQALRGSPAANKLAIGPKITRGMGTGADPAIGRQAALEDTERLIEILEGSDMVFVAAGLGGGTGTGAAPVIATLAKELNALTVAVVTKPFHFEGPRRRKLAERGLAELAATVDTVITIPNDRLLEIVPRGASLVESFGIANDVLYQAVHGISDIMTTPGLINRDFADIRSSMLGMGYAVMGTATAGGENAAVEAARKAIGCPLLEEGGVKGARGVLINITGSSRLGLHDVDQACSLIREATADEDVQVNFGVVLDESMGDQVKITVIATGFPRRPAPVEEREVNGHAFLQPAQASFLEPAGPEPVEPPPASPAAAPPDYAPVSISMPATAMPAPKPATMPAEDLEIPALLRRERRLFQ